MFSNLFPVQQECFICCSYDGKNDTEHLHELMYNTKHMNYPLLSLSVAYNCNCRNSYAHNKCLCNINKCPTCRKVVLRPNIYVNTRYDYYLWFLLDWVKKDISRIEQMKWCAISYMLIMVVLLYMFDKHQKIIDVIIPPKSIQSFCFATIIATLHCVSLYILLLNDYFTKYWLYNSKNKKAYVFHTN